MTQGIIVYKTSSQMGDNKAFRSYEQYREYQKGTNNDAHKIIDTNRVEELLGSEFEITVDRWGNTKVIVIDPNGSETEYTITQFFKKYRY